ncbi:hypothetical protein ACLOJK_002701 [Asimina triloba]
MRAFESIKNIGIVSERLSGHETLMIRCTLVMCVYKALGVQTQLVHRLTALGGLQHGVADHIGPRKKPNTQAWKLVKLEASWGFEIWMRELLDLRAFKSVKNIGIVSEKLSGHETLMIKCNLVMRVYRALGVRTQLVHRLTALGREIERGREIDNCYALRATISHKQPVVGKKQQLANSLWGPHTEMHGIQPRVLHDATLIQPYQMEIRPNNFKSSFSTSIPSAVQLPCVQLVAREAFGVPNCTKIGRGRERRGRNDKTLAAGSQAGCIFPGGCFSTTETQEGDDLEGRLALLSCCILILSF